MDSMDSTGSTESMKSMYSWIHEILGIHGFHEIHGILGIHRFNGMHGMPALCCVVVALFGIILRGRCAIVAQCCCYVALFWIILALFYAILHNGKVMHGQWGTRGRTPKILLPKCLGELTQLPLSLPPARVEGWL